jgi:hypothetical protein
VIAIDWCSKDAVIAYAKRLGKGQTVFKVPDRPNYNITHTSRPDRWQQPGYVLIYQT